MTRLARPEERPFVAWYDVWVIRRLLTLASALSLLLCIAAAVLWVRGRAGAECWYFHPSRPFVIQPPIPSLPAEWCVQWQVGWGRDGRLSVARQIRPVASVQRLGFFSVPARPAAPQAPMALPVGSRIIVLPTGPETKMSLAGVEYVSRRQNFARFPVFGNWGSNWGTWSFKVPLVLLVVLTAVLPVTFAVRRYRQRLRNKEGRCACGYDLRASKDRCPECGTAIPSATVRSHSATG